MSDRDQITAFLLGALDDAEAERVRERASADPEFAAELARARELVARLDALEADEWEPVEPPPLRVEEIVGPGRAEEAARPVRRRWSWRMPLLVRPAFALAAAVALLAVGVGAGALLTSGDGDSGEAGRRVALAPIGDAAPKARATARLDGDTLRLSVRGLPRAPEGDFYEVWMLRSPTELVAMGTFKVGSDGTARVDLPITASAERFPILDVSLEPADGDPAHSGASVLRSRPLTS